MRVPEGQQGKTGICPRCHDAFLIPGQRPAPAPAAAPEPVEAQLVCYCPHCDHEMHIAGHNAGKIGTCPACQGPFTIPGGPVTVTVTVLPDPGEPAPAPAGNPRPKKRRRRRALYDAYLLGDPLRDAHREDQVRGYYLILGIIAVTLFLDLIEVVVQIGNSRRVEEAQQQAAKAKTGERLAPARLQDDPLPVAAHWSALIFGLAIEWILLWGLHQGYGWARMGLVMVFVLFWGGCGVCGILSAGAVRDGPPQTGQILVNLLQIVFRLGMAVLMLASRSVTAFAND
jgi:Zn-finger nucleic acid-binding protein